MQMYDATVWKKNCMRLQEKHTKHNVKSYDLCWN